MDLKGKKQENVMAVKIVDMYHLLFANVCNLCHYLFVYYGLVANTQGIKFLSFLSTVKNFQYGLSAHMVISNSKVNRKNTSTRARIDLLLKLYLAIRNSQRVV